MINFLVTLVLPVLILLTLSNADRLGPIPALLLAIAIPVGHSAVRLLRGKPVTIQSVLGLVSVLLTGVIGVFRLDTVLYPIKEAAVPLAFAGILLASNRTSFPVVRLLFDVVQRKQLVEQRVREVGGERAYRLHIERCGRLWAGIMLVSGTMKATLAGLIVRADTGTEAFNRQLATYELAQVPTSMLVTMGLVLGLIWTIARGTGRITGLPPAEVLRGGRRLEVIIRRGRALIGRGQGRPGEAA